MVPERKLSFFFIMTVSHVEEFNIPKTLITNINQTPLKYVPVSKETMAERNNTSVTLTSVILSGNFSPMQLIYGGKTNQSIPQYNFPENFCLSANPKHFSNTEESLKYLDEDIIWYVVKERLES